MDARFEKYKNGHERIDLAYQWLMEHCGEDVIYDGVEKQFEHNFIKTDENWTNAEKFSTKIKLEHDPINDRYIVLGVNDDYFLYINCFDGLDEPPYLDLSKIDCVFLWNNNRIKKDPVTRKPSIITTWVTT